MIYELCWHVWFMFPNNNPNHGATEKHWSICISLRETNSIYEL